MAATDLDYVRHFSARKPVPDSRPCLDTLCKVRRITRAKKNEPFLSSVRLVAVDGVLSGSGSMRPRVIPGRASGAGIIPHKGPRRKNRKRATVAGRSGDGRRQRIRGRNAAGRCVEAHQAARFGLARGKGPGSPGFSAPAGDDPRLAWIALPRQQSPGSPPPVSGVRAAGPRPRSWRQSRPGGGARLSKLRRRGGRR